MKFNHIKIYPLDIGYELIILNNSNEYITMKIDNLADTIAVLENWMKNETINSANNNRNSSNN